LSIPIELIKELRAATGAGVLDCRAALEANEGDVQKAIVYLREIGLAAATKKEDRGANENRRSKGTQVVVGVLVEVNCETDFGPPSNSDPSPMTWLSTLQRCPRSI
jgi:elongation factor Ts